MVNFPSPHPLPLFLLPSPAQQAHRLPEFLFCFQTLGCPQPVVFSPLFGFFMTHLGLGSTGSPLSICPVSTSLFHESCLLLSLQCYAPPCFHAPPTNLRDGAAFEGAGAVLLKRPCFFLLSSSLIKGNSMLISGRHTPSVVEGPLPVLVFIGFVQSLSVSRLPAPHHFGQPIPVFLPPESLRVLSSSPVMPLLPLGSPYPSLPHPLSCFEEPVLFNPKRVIPFFLVLPLSPLKV